MRIKINEAIAAAKLQGKEVKKKDLAALMFPNSTIQSQSTLMTKACSGKLKRICPEWLQIISQECGVSIEFLLGMEELR